MRIEKMEVTVDGFKGELCTYLLDNYDEIDPVRKRPMVLICPGGGYEMTSKREAEAVAIRYNSFGFHACVLYYSCKPAQYPVALFQLAKSMEIIWENADDWNVNKEKIAINGFSAGGHLALCLGECWNSRKFSQDVGISSAKMKPSALILAYPVVSAGEFANKGSFTALLGTDLSEEWDKLSLEKQINSFVPPVFVWHTCEDRAVPVENSLLLVEGLRKTGIPFELHIYQKGDHGLSLGTKEVCTEQGQLDTDVSNWIEMAARWLQKL